MGKNNVYKINDRYVYVTQGEYQINGRVSNAFAGNYINQDGTLSDEKWCGYGSDKYIKIEHKIQIIIIDTNLKLV